MALLEMQSDMQHKIYSQQYLTTWDLNLDANGSTWLTDKTGKSLQNGQIYHSNFPSSASDLNLWYNKEFLRQTMLKHEAVFKDQIYELHRIYGRQRELMDEMRRNELYEHNSKLKALQQAHSLPFNSFDDIQKTCGTSNFPFVSSVSSPSLASDIRSSTVPLHLVYGKSTQVSLHYAPNEVSSKDPELLESKCKKFCNKILDLELPADEYIDDSEEQEFPEVKMPDEGLQPSSHHKNTISDSAFVTDSTAGFDSKSQADIKNPGSNSLQPKFLGDLNFPLNSEEEATPSSGEFPDSFVACSEASCKDLCGKSNSGLQVLGEGITQNSKIAGSTEVCFRVSSSEEKNGHKKFVTCDNEAGQRKRYINSPYHPIYTERESKTLEQSKLKEAQKCTDSGLNESTRGSSGENHQMVAIDLSTNGCPGPAASSICTSYQIVPQGDAGIAVMSNVSPMRQCEFMCTPIVVQALPCFNPTASLSKSSKLFTDCVSLSGNKSDCNKMIYGILKGSKMDFKVLEGHRLSSSSGSLNCSGDDDSASSQCSAIKDLISAGAETPKHIDASSVAANCIDFAPSKDICHADNVTELEKSIDGTDRKKRIPDINLEFDPMPDSVEHLMATDLVDVSGPSKKFPASGRLIDLNSYINKNMHWSSHSKEIDLEPPASPENWERSPPRGESDENLLERPLLLSGPEDGDLQEELVRTAAEVLVSLSKSGVHTGLGCCSSGSPVGSQSKFLYWFARVASSVVDDPESELGINITVKEHGDDEGYLSDGIDYFEAMTLKLTEINTDEYMCKSSCQKLEEASAISLSSQPRRGRTRRGRQQRKDFQSEILPSLASLSRYEVTEDLQIIGGLMEATGGHGGTGSSRNTGRNWCTRGKRRTTTRASNVTESTLDPLLNQQSCDDQASSQRRLVDWGKITRRPRGPRCPSGHSRLILGQV